ncbi:MAG: recombinase family protein [Planctomycetota bacterium]|jgi:DNA invertase Pin-like site-specific DNA recombinase
MGKSRKIQRQNIAVGYVRRSTDKQEQSILDQRKALEKYTTENGFRLQKFYTDDAISGTSSFRRKAFQQMIKDAQSPQRGFDIIVVYDVKRFGRVDNDEAGYYRYILRIHGVQIRYVSENFNGDTTDDLLRPVKQWQARQESKDLSKVTIRGLLSKVEGGWWMGGVPPYGYDLRYESASGKFLFILRYMQDSSRQLLDENGNIIRILNRKESLNTSKLDRAKLIPSHPERVNALQQIFKMYVQEGKGYKTISDTLNGKGIFSPRGPKWARIYSGKWTSNTIRTILFNPLYTGDLVWNRRTDGRFHRISEKRAVDRENVHGRRLVPNDKKDWIIIPNAHPALISRYSLAMVKDRYDKNMKSLEQRGDKSGFIRHGKTWHGKINRFILSGLLRCDLCQSRYQGYTISKSKRRMDGTRQKNFYYACGGYICKGKSVCNKNPIPKEKLEEKIIETVLDFYKPYLKKGGRNKLLEIIKQETGAEQEDIDVARQRIEDELSRVDKIIENLLDNLTETNRELVNKRLNELNDQRQKLELRLSELDRLSISKAEIQTMVVDAMKFISNLEFILHKGQPQEKLFALRQSVEKVWINKPNNSIRLLIRLVPIVNLETTEEIQTSIFVL